MLSEKKILNETKNHNPSLQVKWSVPKLFSNLGVMVSGPAALWTFKFCNSFKTPFFITLISGNFGMVSLPTSGKLVRSSCVYADLNCALSISALLLVALCNIPSFPLRRATPEFSWFFAFMKDQNLLEFPDWSRLIMSCIWLLYAFLYVESLVTGWMIPSIILQVSLVLDRWTRYFSSSGRSPLKILIQYKVDFTLE